MEAVAEEFAWFADWADGVAPLYAHLSTAVATDERLLEIASGAAQGQPAPNLLFGAVHALLLAGSDHALATYYPTCTANPSAPDDSLVPAFRDFALTHESEIRRLVESRRVQTNAVGRSAVLFPAFKHLVDTVGAQPLALVEIGTSAGLNLYWDRYCYQYDDRTCGNDESPVQIQTTVRGDTRPPLGGPTPEVARRVGIDVNTLAVTDSADAQWLRALVLPDQQYRYDRLDAAIEVVREHPPTLVEGDALDVLPDVLADIPAEYDICVFSTVVLYQFAESEIAALRTLLREASQPRRIHWLSDDPHGDQTPPTYRLVTFDGSERARQLATYKAHGEWIRWRAGES